MSKSKVKKQKGIFRQIADSTLNSVVVFDISTGKCVYINDQAKRALYFEKEPKDLNIEQLISEKLDDGVIRLEEHQLRQNGNFPQIYLRRPNGALFLTKMNVQLISYGDSKLVALTFDDITATRQLDRLLSTKQHEIFRLYQEALQHKRHLEEVNLAKQNFMMLAAHELRTPLSSIIGTADILVRKLFDNDEQKDNMIEIIHKEGIHLLNILTDTLDYLQLQSGQIDLYIEKASIEALTRQQVQMFIDQASAKTITLDLKIGQGDLTAFVDPRRFKQIINNIIDNSLQFSKSGARVTVGVETQEKHVRLFVEDHGPGMTPDQASDVYSKNLTIENALTHHRGTGLGMGYTKKIVESMGGKISFSTTIGQGTTFHVDFPKEQVLDLDFYRSRSEAVDDLAS